MRPLLALDLALGPGLEEAIRQRVLAEEAFCVLDQRLSPRRLQETLELLGATAVIDVNGRHARVSGRDVDDDIGLVMLTSGSSASPKAVLSLPLNHVTRAHRGHVGRCWRRPCEKCTRWRFTRVPDCFSLE